MPFKPGDTVVSSSAAEAFAIGSGVCQDHAHVFIACCRYLGVPARYVSGYVYSPGHEEAHVASHAWAEAWAVDRWRSFDIANNRPAGEDHIRLAVGADYFDACPIRGVRTGGGAETMSAAALVAQQQQ
jgi:transglutaminase-like putative cysteine protease